VEAAPADIKSAELPPAGATVGSGKLPFEEPLSLSTAAKNRVVEDVNTVEVHHIVLPLSPRVFFIFCLSRSKLA
jgi:hypothetical protein